MGCVHRVGSSIEGGVGIVGIHPLDGKAASMSPNKTHRLSFEAERTAAPGFDSTLSGPKREDLEAVDAALHEVANASHPLGGSPISISAATPPPVANAQQQKVPLPEMKNALDAANFFGAKSPALVSLNIRSMQES